MTTPIEFGTLLVQILANLFKNCSKLKIGETSETPTLGKTTCIIL
jgi:hypothetical protein